MITKDKAYFRKKALEIRDNMSLEYRISSDKEIFEKVKAIIKNNNYENVLVFCSYKSEVDTWNIISYLLSEKINVFCPKIIDKKSGLMEFYKIKSIDDLQETKLGISEPCAGFLFDIKENKKTFMIMPGVAFDIYRNRIGYNGGFYDRFLEKCKNKNPKCIYTAAICYDEQVFEDKFVMDKTDIKPDILITQKRILAE